MVACGPALLRPAVPRSENCASCKVYPHSRVTVAFADARRRAACKRRQRPQAFARRCVTCSSTAAQLQSETELFLDNLEKEAVAELPSGSDLRAQVLQLEIQVGSEPVQPQAFGH